MYIVAGVHGSRYRLKVAPVTWNRLGVLLLPFLVESVVNYFFSLLFFHLLRNAVFVETEAGLEFKENHLIISRSFFNYLWLRVPTTLHTIFSYDQLSQIEIFIGPPGILKLWHRTYWKNLILHARQRILTVSISLVSLRCTFYDLLFPVYVVYRCEI